jgi:hypothetical protein
VEGDSCKALFKSVFLCGKAEAMSSRWGCIVQNEHILSNRVLMLWVTIKTALFRYSIRINFPSVLSLHTFAPLFIMAPINMDTIQFYNPLLSSASTRYTALSLNRPPTTCNAARRAVASTMQMMIAVLMTTVSLPLRSYFPLHARRLLRES